MLYWKVLISSVRCVVVMHFNICPLDVEMIISTNLYFANGLLENSLVLVHLE